MFAGYIIGFGELKIQGLQKRVLLMKYKTYIKITVGNGVGDGKFIQTINKYL